MCHGLRVSVVAVTGATGFIGQIAVRALARRGHTIIAVSRNSLSPTPAVFHVRGSLGAALDLGDAPVPNLVIHLAHDFSPDALALNVQGTEQWFCDFERHGAQRQVLMSSLSVLVDTRTPYSASKRALESFFSSRSQPTLRPGLVIGAGGMFGMLAKVMQLSPMTAIPGTRAPRLYLTALPELIDALESLLPPATLEHPLARNIVTWGPVSFRELASQLRAPSKRRGIVVAVPGSVFDGMLRVGAAVAPRLQSFRESYDNLLATDLLMREEAPQTAKHPMTPAALQALMGPDADTDAAPR